MALSLYFLPHGSQKQILNPTRPSIIKWYCPFAAQRDFPSGHRYCINVYTGCSHECVYCYAAGYEPDKAGSKKNFERLLEKDLADLARFDVPPAPVHLSNSTDPFQPLEVKLGHTLYTLKRILAFRNRFTTVTILTKNPLLPVQNGYLDIMQKLTELPTNHPRYHEFKQKNHPGFQIEVSLAFGRRRPGNSMILMHHRLRKALRGFGVCRKQKFLWYCELILCSCVLRSQSLHQNR